MLYYTSLQVLLTQLPLYQLFFLPGMLFSPKSLQCSLLPVCQVITHQEASHPHGSCRSLPYVLHFLLLLSRTHLLTLGVQICLVPSSPGIQQVFSKHVQNEYSKCIFNIWKNPVVIHIHLTHWIMLRLYLYFQLEFPLQILLYIMSFSKDITKYTIEDLFNISCV